MSRLWKINCMEHKYPGMWRRWFRNQCVAIGWASVSGYQLDGGIQEQSWSRARNAIKDMRIGDYIVASLRGNRVGRVGQITGKAVEDGEWKPLVPVSKTLPYGEMGRRIFVRWELTTGPDSQDQIIQLPEYKTFNNNEVRQPVSKITSMTIAELREIMNDQKNWVSLSGKFNYEKAISDYIAYYPHHLEDGLLRYPDKKVRENVFNDRTRSDVLLIDRAETPVVVECKQYAPSFDDIKQLRGYMKRLECETEKEVRGILVHGGPQKISNDIIAEAKKAPDVEIVSYNLKVDFRPSF